MRRWWLTIAFWLGLYWFVLGVARHSILGIPFIDLRVLLPALLGATCLSIWKVWTDV